MNSRPQILIDVKNIALYTGGIAAFFKPIVIDLVASRPQYDFILAGPIKLLPSSITDLPCRLVDIPWQQNLPAKFRHPVYDNLQFPLALRRIKPRAVISPYHDVRIDRKIPSMITIHDCCYQEFGQLYPKPLVAYHMFMLRSNIRKASRIMTVSKTSKKKISSIYGIEASTIGVVYNSFEPNSALINSVDGAAVDGNEKSRNSTLIVFYPGGSDYRKNVKNLLDAIAIVNEKGVLVDLLISGLRDERWEKIIGKTMQKQTSHIHFLGRLTDAEVVSYYSLADVVVYPTLCEGFGRVVLEAMSLGKPIACSDLEVLKEIGGKYPVYFNPINPLDIANSILIAATKKQVPVLNPEYKHKNVMVSFFALFDDFMKSV